MSILLISHLFNVLFVCNVLACILGCVTFWVCLNIIGAKVIMACRSLDKASEAIDDIKVQCKDVPNLGSLQAVKLDLTSLKSVRECADSLLKSEEKIDILLNNAGIMACPLYRTEDGFEMQFGTNHLGHFLFTMLLMPKILASDYNPARIVNVSSTAHTSKYFLKHYVL